MYIDVIVDILNTEVDRIFEYSYFGDRLERGCRVRVPFGNKIIDGIVINVKEKCDYNPDKIKPIFEVIDEPPVLTEETLKLSNYVTDTYYVTKASALRLFLPSEMRKGKIREKFQTFYLLNNDVDVKSLIEKQKKNAKNRRALLEHFLTEKEISSLDASKISSLSAVKDFVDLGILKPEKRQNQRIPYQNLDFAKKEISLTEAQNNAINVIKTSENPYSLIFGVTGSGKTEVYLNLIEQTLKEDKTAIMLVPEIALTPQMFRQLKARFNNLVAILHSGLTAGERFDEWWRLRNGEAKIAVGARSAIFAPLENIGLIIIDEEHDGSYLSESAPRYSTVKLAKFRAKENGAKLVLGSATPSVESFLKARSGEYNLIEMPDRINKKPMPEVEIADMRGEIRRGNNTPFSRALISELETCIKNGNQAIIFLNQRGYSRSVICTSCGHVVKCEACDVSLTYHKEDNALLCHYCGAKYKMIDACPECGSKFLRFGGTGTERIVYELNKLFPFAKILRMDRDTTKNKEGHLKILSEFSQKKADILVGTQMIAKGHDFPDVTLVGILDADMSLYFSDFRSGERTFALITQVAGRCGRGNQKGKVVLQTYSPDNPVLKRAISYDYVGFFEHEISVRKATAFPPFTDIVRVLISGEKEEETVEVTKNLYQDLQKTYTENKDKFRFFGCMKAPLKRLQNKFRYQILMRITADSKDICDTVYACSEKYNGKRVTTVIEINSNNLT